MVVVELAVRLDDGGMIDRTAFALEHDGDYLRVGSPSVRVDLEVTASRPLDVFDELDGVEPVALAEVPREDELRMPLDRDVAVGIAAILGRVLLDGLLLLHTDESPNLVSLHVRCRDSRQAIGQERLALLADAEEQREDSPLRDSCQPRRGADRATFRQVPENVDRLVERETHVVEHRIRAIRPGRAARLALESLVAVAVATELAGFNLAGRAEHRNPSSTLQLYYA